METLGSLMTSKNYFKKIQDVSGAELILGTPIITIGGDGKNKGKNL